MELIYKAASAAIISSVLGLLIRKRNPELAILLSAAAVLVILLAVCGYLTGIIELSAVVKTTLGAEERYTAPVLKCLAVALITRVASDLCRDASQAAAASVVELSGIACAISIVIPLISGVLNLVGGLI